MHRYVPGLFAVLFWGLAPIVLKDLVARSSAGFTTSTAYSLVAFLLLPQFIRSWRVRRWDMRTLAKLFVCGVMLISAFNFLAARASPHVSGTIIAGTIALEPLMIMLTYATLNRALPSGQQFLGATVSIVGVALLLHEQLGNTSHPSEWWAIALIALGAAVWSVAVVLVGRLQTSMGALESSLVLIFLGACPFVLTLEQGYISTLAELDARAVAELLFIAGAATIFSNFLWYRSIQLLGPTRTGTLINLIPLFSVVFAFLVLGEPLTYLKIGSLFTIIFGVYLSSRNVKDVG